LHIIVFCLAVPSCYGHPAPQRFLRAAASRHLSDFSALLSAGAAAIPPRCSQPEPPRFLRAATIRCLRDSFVPQPSGASALPSYICHLAPDAAANPAHRSAAADAPAIIRRRSGRPPRAADPRSPPEASPNTRTPLRRRPCARDPAPDCAPPRSDD